MSFVHRLSCIPRTPDLCPPSPEQLIGLTPDSIWSWFLTFLGWHRASLPPSTEKQVRQTFDSLPQSVRFALVRHDILPHRAFHPDSFQPDSIHVRRQYACTSLIRKAAVRNSHRLYPKRSLNIVEPYPDSHQLWLPEAEAHWLKTRLGMSGRAEGKSIDFPLSLRFTLRLPSSSSSSVSDDGASSQIVLGQRVLMSLNHDDFWPIYFASRTRRSLLNHIAFDHHQSALAIDLPSSLQLLGRTWIEAGRYGPKNRVLFQKTCKDDLTGILLWPSFGSSDHHPTPRIPVYNNEIIQLVDGDRLLIFAGPKRGLDDATIQIEISATWASQLYGHLIDYVDLKYLYPNPSERYPHCLQRPLHTPKDTLDPEILQDAVRPLSEFEADQKVILPTEISDDYIVEEPSELVTNLGNPIQSFTDNDIHHQSLHENLTKHSKQSAGSDLTKSNQTSHYPKQKTALKTRKLDSNFDQSKILDDSNSIKSNPSSKKRKSLRFSPTPPSKRTQLN